MILNTISREEWSVTITLLIFSMTFTASLNICRKETCYGHDSAQPVKIVFEKKLDLKQKTIQTFNIYTLRFRKTKNENHSTQEIGVAS